MGGEAEASLREVTQADASGEGNEGERSGAVRATPQVL